MSGGEQQMLAIARSMMLEPKIVLLDEPTEGLMPRMVTQIREIIDVLHREGVAILGRIGDGPGVARESSGCVANARSAVRHVAATTPRNGTARNMPRTPAIALPAGIAMRTTAGCRLTARLYTIGATKFPWTMFMTTV